MQKSVVKIMMMGCTLALTGLMWQATAGDVPAQLPRLDGKPGDTTKKVKVFIEEQKLPAVE
jgi:hypothetical protein